MSRIRLILLGLLAVFTVGAIASASASAAECKHEAGSGHFTVCIGSPLELASGSFKVDVKDDGTSEYVLKAAGITVTCGLVEGTGEIDSEADMVKFLNVVLKFTKCTVTVAEHCVVENGSVTTEKLEGKIIKKEEAQFFPAKKGTLFATIVIKSSGGTCPFPGSDKVTTEGKKTEVGPICTSAEIETTKEVHLLKCEGSKSHLEFISKAAEFNGNFDTLLLLEPKSGETVADVWDIVEGL